ncbi:hypothetical protein DFP73DRAFT_484088 [Morchella snyderi]|nr:hypothetical protein DFP73DRAFT_484088 [Morchella snyderi]
MIIRSGWEGRRYCRRKFGKAANLDVSPHTIQPAIARKRYHRFKACKKRFLSCKNQQERTAYANQHLHKTTDFWLSQMYSDECTFDTSARGSAWVTRVPGERFY